MSASSRKTFGYATLALHRCSAFVVAVVASNVWLRGVRIDLTENDLYTLGEGTQAVLDGIEEPINLYFFFSNEATEHAADVCARTPTRVREMLEEFAAQRARRQARAQRRRPAAVLRGRGPRRAVRAAGRATSARAGEAVYFGLAGSNSVGTTDRIPFFQPDPRKEAVPRVRPRASSSTTSRTPTRPSSAC